MTVYGLTPGTTYFFALMTDDEVPNTSPISNSPSAAATTDSTPLIRRFEREFEGRSVIPPDPALVFLDELLEDFADEWLTKCMFHYRWYPEADATKARLILPHWSATEVTDEEIAPIQKMIGDRQIGRLWVVGSNDVTAEVIEQSYLHFLSAHHRQLKADAKKMYATALKTVKRTVGLEPVTGAFQVDPDILRYVGKNAPDKDK